MTRIILFTLFLFSSCAGYRFQHRDNPFKQYGIKSVSVPMFYNQTPLANVSGVFTKEIFKMLTTFDNLKVVGGNKKSDATIIGIIQSEGRVIDTIIPSAPRSIRNIDDKDLTNSRSEFYIPSASTVQIVLRIIVIKDPTVQEIEFLKSDMSKQDFVSSKIIFSELVPLSSAFTREVVTGKNGEVIHTQNSGALKKTIISLSKSASETFREMILYAF